MKFYSREDLCLLKVNSLKLPQQMVLTDADIKSQNESTIDFFAESFAKTLENLTNVAEMSKVTQQIVTALMLPSLNVEKVSIALDNHLRKYSNFTPNESSSNKMMFIRVLELYKHILPSLSDDHIAEMAKHEPIISLVKNGEIILDVDVLTHSLQLVDALVKICASRKNLLNKIIKYYNDSFKICFALRLTENLFATVIENYVMTRMLNDVYAMPVVKLLLVTIKNILTHIPTNLDESFMNLAFQVRRLFESFLILQRSNFLEVD